MALYTNFHSRELLTAEQMHADLLERDPGERIPLDEFLSNLTKRGRVDHPYYEVTEIADPGDGRTLAALCVMKENPILLADGETWDGTPVMWFETEWVEA
jgi:hypothetical protein